MRLVTIEKNDTCIACYEQTHKRVSCCNAPICKECYLEWLKVKRQCMHCYADQCEFDDWVNNYRVEPQLNLVELNALFQIPGDLGTGFNLDTMLNTIRQTTGDSIPTLLLEGLETMPTANEHFGIEYGFTVTPMNGGPGFTITQYTDHNTNDSNMYQQLIQTLQEYNRLFLQNTVIPSPPLWEDSGSESDIQHEPFIDFCEYILNEEPPPEWPWP